MAKHVTSGEKFHFSARTYNEMNQFIESQRMSGLSMQAQSAAVNNDFVLVKNTSAVDVGRFGVLGIAGILFDPQTALPAFTSRVVFTGAVPQASLHKDGRFLICAEPIKQGAIGRAWADGIVTCRIDVVNQTHNYATIKPNDVTQLVSGNEGLCYILYKQTGTGQKWAIVRFGSASSASATRWAFYKAYKNAGTCTAYLEANITGQVVDVSFILTGGCNNHTEGHITIVNGLRMPVMLDGETWICMYPLQGVDICS